MTLSQISASIIYCSPLRRACETAQYIRAPETKTLEALREIHYGQWTGLSWSEIERNNPERASLKMTNWTGVTPPFGEAWSDFLLRLRPVCDEIRNGPQPAAVVAHQTVNAALAFLLADRNPLEFRQDYGEVIRVCFT